MPATQETTIRKEGRKRIDLVGREAVFSSYEILGEAPRKQKLRLTAGESNKLKQRAVSSPNDVYVTMSNPIFSSISVYL